MGDFETKLKSLVLGAGRRRRALGCGLESCGGDVRAGEGPARESQGASGEPGCGASGFFHQGRSDDGPLAHYLEGRTRGGSRRAKPTARDPALSTLAAVALIRGLGASDREFPRRAARVGSPGNP